MDGPGPPRFDAPRAPTVFLSRTRRQPIFRSAGAAKSPIRFRRIRFTRDRVGRPIETNIIQLYTGVENICLFFPITIVTWPTPSVACCAARRKTTEIPDISLRRFIRRYFVRGPVRYPDGSKPTSCSLIDLQHAIRSRTQSPCRYFISNPILSVDTVRR